MHSWTHRLIKGDHVLHMYENVPEQEQAVLELFNWASENAKMFYFTSKKESEYGITSFSRDGNLSARLVRAIKEGRLQILDSEKSYLTNGVFDPKITLQNVITAAESAREDGYSSMVAVGDPLWLAGRRGDIPRFVSYEAGLNLLRLPIETTFICQYDKRVFAKEDLERLRWVHDKVLSNQVLERNCWFLSNKKKIYGIRA
ncbi:MAG: MEDS domain-containing protein [Methanomassiliicoccales archaeon]